MTKWLKGKNIFVAEFNSCDLQEWGGKGGGGGVLRCISVAKLLCMYQC